MTNTKNLLSILIEIENMVNIKRKVEHELKALEAMYNGATFPAQKPYANTFSNAFREMVFYLSVGGPACAEECTLMSMGQEERITEYIAKSYEIVDTDDVKAWQDSLYNLYKEVRVEQKKLNSIRILLGFTQIEEDYEVYGDQ